MTGRWPSLRDQDEDGGSGSGSSSGRPAAVDWAALLGAVLQALTRVDEAGVLIIDYEEMDAGNERDARFTFWVLWTGKSSTPSRKTSH